jgi:2-keto-4-pentenoate hydratase/2-oxohepta-3-ene-1,7-dioic acid hydratase in catechol pathway
MKLVSYVRTGSPGFGASVEGGIVDLTGRIAPDIVSLKGLLAADRVADARAYVDGRRADFARSDVRLLPVVPDPSKILCIGLNYEKHRAETRRPDSEYPAVFTRYADSQVADGEPIVRPRVSDRLDYEAELAIVIGCGGRYIDEAVAMEHVAGYSCYNDGSVRDWQRHTHQFTPGKTFPGTGAFGPWLVTADEVADYRQMSIRCILNGEVMQDATLDQLIFPLPRLIAYCSSFTPLQPGDVIITGTPGGVGDRREPPVYMKPGDVVAVEIGGVGRLVNPIVAEE